MENSNKSTQTLPDSGERATSIQVAKNNKRKPRVSNTQGRTVAYGQKVGCHRAFCIHCNFRWFTAETPRCCPRCNVLFTSQINGTHGEATNTDDVALMLNLGSGNQTKGINFTGGRFKSAMTFSRATVTGWTNAVDSGTGGNITVTIQVDGIDTYTTPPIVVSPGDNLGFIYDWDNVFSFS